MKMRREKKKRAGIAVMMLMAMMVMALSDTVKVNAAGETEKYYVQATEALLDIFCKADTTAFVNLGLGTSAEAYEAYDENVGRIMMALLTEAGADTYYSAFQERIEDMLDEAAYRVDSAVVQGNSVVLTVTYQQFGYFQQVESYYKEYVKTVADGWMMDPSSAKDAEDMAETMLAALILSMDKALETAVYTKPAQARINIGSDIAGNLMSFVYSQLFDMNKVKPYVTADKKGAEIRGYADNHSMYYWFDTGSLYIGEWEDDIINGQGIYVWEDGDVYAGGWKNGKKNGYGVYVWPDGTIHKGQWANDKQIK